MSKFSILHQCFALNCSLVKLCSIILYIYVHLSRCPIYIICITISHCVSSLQPWTSWDTATCTSSGCKWKSSNQTLSLTSPVCFSTAHKPLRFDSRSSSIDSSAFCSMRRCCKCCMASAGATKTMHEDTSCR